VPPGASSKRRWEKSREEKGKDAPSTKKSGHQSWPREVFEKKLPCARETNKEGEKTPGIEAKGHRKKKGKVDVRRKKNRVPSRGTRQPREQREGRDGNVRDGSKRVRITRGASFHCGPRRKLLGRAPPKPKGEDGPRKFPEKNGAGPNGKKWQTMACRQTRGWAVTLGQRKESVKQGIQRRNNDNRRRGPRGGRRVDPAAQIEKTSTCHEKRNRKTQNLKRKQ